MKRRADLLLVERGFLESRARAQEAIAAGLVTANGRPVTKASALLDPDAALQAGAPHPWVSRGGVKLAHALDVFALDPAGRVALDVGASTGGFSQVLLSRGAARVIAIEGGRDQLHPSLQGHPRLLSLESTDIRTLETAKLPAAPDLAVIDVSFISLTLVLPAVARLLAPQADIIALIKPQFEVGRAALGKGGLVKDRAAAEAAIERLRETLVALRFVPSGVIDSPIAGGDGNREHLVLARRIPA